MKEPDIQDVMVEINDLRQRVFDLEEQSIVYNSMIIAMAMLANIKPAGFKYITPEEYKDYLKKNMQPFAKQVMEISQKANQLIKEEEDVKDVKDKRDKANES